MNEELTDFLVVEGKNAVELIVTHPEINKLTGFIAELMGRGYEAGPRLFLAREHIADILNVLGSIDIDYNNIEINKMKDGLILYFNVDLREVLRKTEFLRTMEGLWLGVSVYCFTNNDYKLVKGLINKYSMDILNFNVMYSKRQ